MSQEKDIDNTKMDIIKEKYVLAVGLDILEDKEILVLLPTKATFVIFTYSFPLIEFSEETTVAPINGVISATLSPLTVT